MITLDVNYKEIGERVAKRRRVLNLTQEELAEIANLSKTHIQNIERASSKCSVASLLRLSGALQVNPDYLLSGAYKQLDESDLDFLKSHIFRCNPKRFDLVLNFIAWTAEQDLN